MHALPGDSGAASGAGRRDASGWGYYTVGPEEAQAIVEAIRPRVVIPMHYRSDRFGFDVLAPVENSWI